MALYTIIVEFSGGTYISQIRASSPTNAIKRWALRLENDPDAMSITSKEKLARQLEADAERPSPVKGIRNTWCLSAILHRKLALIHLVKTEDGEFVGKRFRSA